MSGDKKQTFVIGTRRSKLALVQTHEVKGKLEALYPDYTFVLFEQDTKGDKVLDVALSKIGDKGLFTQELEDGLRDGSVDFAVHSLKDLPTSLPAGMTVGAILQRVDPTDVVLIRKDLSSEIKSLEQLQHTSHRTVGTSSLRRQAQLKRQYPHLQFVDIRGNLDTRIRKLDNEAKEFPTEYGAIVLAHAGLSRQGTAYTSRVSEFLPHDIMHYAVGQGALGIECRDKDERVLSMLSKLHDPTTATACATERAFLGRLEGGCHVPVGVNTQVDTVSNTIKMHGRILSLDGGQMVEGGIEGPLSDSKRLGTELANQLLSQGGKEILESIDEHNGKQK